MPCSIFYDIIDISDMAALNAKGVLIMAKQTIYNAGIYVRLSQEDMRAGESLSIENQKLILTSMSRNRAGISSTFMLMTDLAEQVLTDQVFRGY